MSRTRAARRRGAIRAGLALALTTLLVATATPATVLGVGEIHEHAPGYGTVDHRTGKVLPNATQKAMVRDMGASVRWNVFGTPQSLIRHGGSLATGVQGSDAPAAARAWLSSRKALFRLSSTSASSLEMLADTRMVQSDGHAVIFRQRFGGIPAGIDGLITVALDGNPSSGWRIAYVSSSSAGTQAAPQTPTLGAAAAWRAAAADVGHEIAAGDLTNQRTAGGWTLFDVESLSHPARARLVAVPVPGAGVRAAYETIVLDVRGGHAEAYTHFVNARSGAILARQDRVQELAQDRPEATATTAFDAPSAEPFTGEMGTDPATCGPYHGPYTAGSGVRSIIVTAVSPGNDIILELHRPQGTVVASSDIPLGENPEVINYEPSTGVPAGDYFVRVCPFGSDLVGPPNYAGSIAFNDLANTSVPYPPRWRWFPANPPMGGADTDTRLLGCWDNVAGQPSVPHPACQVEFKNLASRGPWDYSFNTNTPTFTTLGNNASTAEAWLSPLTPAEQYRPVFSDRQYDPEWTDRWRNSQCDPAALGPTIGDGPRPVQGGNDIDAAIVNLFTDHNRMHDWSYFLGFTENNFNLQVSNFGNGGAQGDPEIGNVQAGAVTGGYPEYLGRDNANQITLNDGIPGITNMYLWQPLAAGFYAPCVDGSYDMSVIGHEYTHAISNRMVGGPDGNITSAQGGAMGESWSDLAAVEYLNALGYVPTNDEHPFAIGPYVTGSKVKGIRNYNMTMSPLNYSNVGYDFACNASLIPPPVTEPCIDGRQQVHADGEIWSATNYDIRQALIAKYDAAYPASDRQLQQRCAVGKTHLEPPQAPLPPQQCPGNRRWIQLVFDAFLMLQSDLSMLDARDALLAADVMRFGGANQRELWRAFAKRGFGQFASSADGEDADPRASFETPREANESTVTFRVRAIDESGAPNITTARVFVGRYEAGITPVADTSGSTPLANNVKLYPGTYQFVVQAPGYGHMRFTRTIPASQQLTVVVNMSTNWASSAKGGSVSGEGINKNKLIDDTEATNWAVLGRAPSIRGAAITVDLGGTQARLVDKVRVSAMLRPRDLEDPGDDPEPGEQPGDTEGQSRFSALRSFEIWTCRQSVTSDCAITGWVKRGTFIDAFPGERPRPRVTDLNIREFDVTDSMATHVRLVAVDNQCTAPGTPYQGEQDNDPTNATDCDTVEPLRFGENQGVNLRAAELQVISGPGGTSAYEDPLVTVAMTGPATATQGSDVTYTTTFTNLGPADASSAKLVATVPSGMVFRSATDGGVWDSSKRTVTWSLGTIPLHFTDSVGLTLRVGTGVEDGTTLLTTATLTAPKTIATPAASATMVE